jgi:Domain of unknown function (DUF5925)/ATPase family associated with various cellular activities (AAA)
MTLTASMVGTGRGADAKFSGNRAGRRAIISVPAPIATFDHQHAGGEPMTRALSDRIDIATAHSPEETLAAMAHHRFATGEYPYAQRLTIATDPDATHQLTTGTVRRFVTTNRRTTTLVEGDTWSCVIGRDRDGETFATVLATTATQCDVIATELNTWKVADDQDESLVSMTFMTRESWGTSHRHRRITAPLWSQVRHGYSARAALEIDALMARTPQHLPGRLVLLWGPPGTGKSSVLRSLARQWRDWCDVFMVLDNDRLFHDPSYVLDEVLGEDDDDERSDRWKLIVLEDCDELLRSQAGNGALSRLLNLTDGLIGAHTKTMFCLTTNAEVWHLHPAVTRPGRCLAEIEIGPLSLAEAGEWLAVQHPAHVAQSLGLRGSASLAELHQRAALGGASASAATQVDLYGAYL